MKKQEIEWLITEKYGQERGSGVFKEPIEEIKNHYAWGNDYAKDLARLESGEPIGYVIGWVPFLNCKIWLDSKPLIPRPETEFWVEEALQRITAVSARTKRPVKVLDLCAGSGCIGVAVAKAVPDCVVDFVELDEKHHSTIEKNLTENRIIRERSKIIGGSLFSNVHRSYDFILTNPPYLDPNDNEIDDSVKDHEPGGALYGGKQGLETIFTIINEAKKHLTSIGQLWIEHEPGQVELIRALGNTREFLTQVGYDQYNLARFSKLSM